jgi:acyl-CoA thioester hydrolase
VTPPVEHWFAAGWGQMDFNGRFRMINQFWREDGTAVARVTSLGGWLGFEQRRLVPPPAALADVVRALPRSEDYADIPG